MKLELQVLEFVISRGFQNHLDPNNPQQMHFGFKFGLDA